MKVEIKFNAVEKVGIKTKLDEENKELIGTITVEGLINPSQVARLLNLQKTGAPLFMLIGSDQAMMDLSVEPMREKEPVAAGVTPSDE